MQINQTTQASSIYQLQSQRSVTPKTYDNNTSTQAISDQVSISSAGRNAEAKWQAIADKYDVTNISTHERGAMTNELMENKLISSTEALTMMAPISMNHDPETKVNFLDLTKKGLEFAKSNGAPQKQIELMERVANILEQLHGLAGRTDNNTQSKRGF